MPLTGTYQRSLDVKRRVAVPKRLREDFGVPDVKLLYIAPGTDRSLSVYSTEGFEEFARKLSERSPTREDVRSYLRLFYAQAERVDVDQQGRIRIPDRLAEFAQLQREVVLLGVHDHAEIWNAETWNQFMSARVSQFDDMASRAFE
ncbi:MAG: division/cell wall cluster transcriptional repressor MraZ [Planctomycetota bacterium]|nr:division/cell wall cluster transcriptional repressor MraZ [Planctomycetota bacterium]MDA1212915.1 division/cell wall cluster transcriptional repressor MraZ [Planctomycetota bacterium]